MKSFVSILGTVLIILGILGFSYRYFTYNSEEKLAEIGSLKVTAQEEKAVVIPPILSGICLIGGIVLVIVGTRKF